MTAHTYVPEMLSAHMATSDAMKMPAYMLMRTKKLNLAPQRAMVQACNGLGKTERRRLFCRPVCMRGRRVLAPALALAVTCVMLMALGVWRGDRGRHAGQD